MLTKSSTELVRQRNSVLVLAALRRHGLLAHTELSDFTGLSSATISAITADLEKAQVIEKSEQQAASGRGRPRVQFRQRRDCGYLIVVIISSDGVQYSLVDYAGKLIDRFSEERSHDPDGAADSSARCATGWSAFSAARGSPAKRSC
jgi:predicted ArsR family transcriptional regulator